MPVDRRVIANAIGARLSTVSNATGYYGEIGRPLPGQSLIKDGGTIPPSPLPKSGTDLRVKPYFVLWPGVGAPGPELDLGDTVEDLDITARVTAAGGVADDVLALVDRIHAALYRWAPTVPGVVCGPLRYPPGWNPGSIRTATDVTPWRYFVPLEYQLTATT